LVSKSGLLKAERDKLKKRPKRKIYDLETLMAGLSEEEIDALEFNEEKKEEAVAAVTVEDSKESEEVLGEEEIAVVEVEEVIAEPLSESEMAKMEAENTMINALAQRDQIMAEQMEEVKLKRKENLEVAASKTMKSNAEVKQHEVAVSEEMRKVEIKTSKSKEVVALRRKTMMTMIAESKRKSATESKESAPAEAVEKQRETTPKVKRPSSVTVADKDKKDLNGTVVIVRNRIKVTDAMKKPVRTQKTEAKVQKYKPGSFQFKEESIYKTVTNTVIKYPVRQDTLQHVEYLWGLNYYYKNTIEIDEGAYNKVLNSLK